MVSSPSHRSLPTHTHWNTPSTKRHELLNAISRRFCVCVCCCFFFFFFFFVVLFFGGVFSSWVVNTLYSINTEQTVPAFIIEDYPLVSHMAANVVQSGSISIWADDFVGWVSAYSVSSRSLATVWRLALWPKAFVADDVTVKKRFCRSKLRKYRSSWICLFLACLVSALSACNGSSSCLLQHGNNRTFLRYGHG